MWLNRPTVSGRIVCSCGFALKERLPFVNAINELGYVQVDEVRQIDQDYSTLILYSVHAFNEVFEQLIEDIPKLMEQYFIYN